MFLAKARGAKSPVASPGPRRRQVGGRPRQARDLLLAVAFALLSTGTIYFANQLGGRHWFDVLLLGPLLIAG